MRNGLHALVFEEKQKNKEKVFYTFMSILEELGFYDQEFTDDERTKTLLLTLPESFKMIEMLCIVKQMSVKDFVDATNSKIELQKNVYKNTMLTPQLRRCQVSQPLTYLYAECSLVLRSGIW